MTTTLFHIILLVASRYTAAMDQIEQLVPDEQPAPRKSWWLHNRRCGRQKLIHFYSEFWLQAGIECVHYLPDTAWYCLWPVCKGPLFHDRWWRDLQRFQGHRFLKPFSSDNRGTEDPGCSGKILFVSGNLHKHFWIIPEKWAKCYAIGNKRSWKPLFCYFGYELFG